MDVYPSVRPSVRPSVSVCFCLSVTVTVTVLVEQEGKGWDVQLGQLMWALEKGMYLAGALFTISSYIACVTMLGLPVQIWYAVVIGLVAGMAIGKITGWMQERGYIDG